MARRLFRDSAIYASAGVLGQGIAFLLFPFLAHTLHPRQYGVIDIVSLLTVIALLTVALEITQGLGRMLAASEDERERSAYASTALIWSACSYAVLVAAGLVFARPLTHVLLGSHVDVWVMRTAVCGVWVAGVLGVLQAQMQWQLRPKAFATVSAVVAAATAAATAVYVFALGAGALGVVAGQLTGASVGLVTALALSPGTYRWVFERAKARAMLSFSIPLVPSSIGVFLNGYADRLAIQHQQSLSEVGVYGVGFRVSVVVSLLLVGVQGATTPIVVSRHAEPETPRDLARAFRVFWAAGCIVFLLLSVLAEPLVRLISAPAYFGGARVVPFLVAAAFLAGLYVFAPGPIIAGRTRVYVIVNLGAGLLNLGLAFALVPSLGIIGAGVATAASSLVMFAATMAASQRLYPVHHNWTRLAMAAAISIAIVAVTRSLLVSGPADALSAGPILGRLGIGAVGTLVVMASLASSEELGAVRSRARGLRAGHLQRIRAAE